MKEIFDIVQYTDVSSWRAYHTPHAPLFFTPESFRDTSFLCVVVLDLPAEPIVDQRLQFLQFLLRVGLDLPVNFKIPFILDPGFGAV